MTDNKITERFPLSIIPSWGLTWFSAKSGAQAHVLRIRKPDTVIIKSDTKKYGSMWASATSAKVCDLIKKNCGLYEIIADFPHKLYFDIDCKNPVLDKPILNEVLQQIRTIWPKGNFAISGSIVEGVKESYHLVSDCYMIHNEEERKLVKIAVKHLQTLNDAFDWKVYTPNRPMKCINQAKRDGRVQQIIECDDFRKHLICSFLPENAEHIDCHFDEPMKQRVAIENAHAKFDLASLPKVASLPVISENITWGDLDAKAMLAMCPYNEKDFSFSYVHKLERFAFYHGISYEEFLKIMNWVDLPADRAVWNKLQNFPPFSMEQMKRLLCFYYPALNKDHHMTAFENMFNLPDDVVTTKIDRLAPEHYNPEFKATILNLTMGSGKTAQTIDFLKQTVGGFCWIAHNKALVAGTLGRLANARVECKDYLGFNATSKKAGALNSARSLCICANSLHYISFEKRYETLVIDEIESVVDAFLGDFMKAEKAQNFAIFKNLILHSKKLILIDAFITMKTINLIKLIDPAANINVVCQANVTPSKTITFCSPADSSNDDKNVLCNALNNICEYIKTNKRVFIFYPYKRPGANYLGMDDVAKLIKDRTGCRVVSYNADSDDSVKAGLTNVNKTWSEYDCVICNQVITCGVNFDLNGFNKVFMFLASFVKPRQSIQVSARIRSLKSNSIKVFYLGRQANTECIIDDRHLMNCPVYSRLYDDSLIEDNAPRRPAFELFCKKAPYIMERAKFVIDAEISKEIEDFCKANFEFKFENIEEISAAQASNIEGLIMSQECPMYMKYELKKYYFMNRFAANDAHIETIKNAWNMNLFGLVDKLTTSDLSLFESIKTANGWDSIFTPPANRKQIVIDPATIERIFQEFKFRTISKTSSKNKIFKSIVNTAFKANIVCSNTSKDKNGKSVNVEYYINEDLIQLLEPLLDLCKNFFKEKVVLPPLNVGEDQREDCSEEEEE
jgi:hypothetical protein